MCVGGRGGEYMSHTISKMGTKVYFYTFCLEKNYKNLNV